MRGNCMRCYLLEKRIQFLEQVLQMKRESCDASTQTEEDVSDTETEVDESVVETEIAIRFITVKTEDKCRDVLFWTVPLRIHFIQEDSVIEGLSEYDGKYISLNKITSFMEQRSDITDRNEYERIVFLERVLRARKPFLRTFRVAHGYDADDSSLHYKSFRSFRFTFEEI